MKYIAEYHGRDGPLTVEPARHSTWLLEAFLKAGLFHGYSVHDPNGGQGQTGFSPFLYTIKDGKRWTTADAYLRPAVRHRTNLNVALNAHVRHVVFDDNNKAVGVLVSRNGGRPFEVRASKEVILCAGTIGSPHLLMLSGIGPAQNLKQAGVPLIQDLQGVGRNLQDHVAAYGLTWTTRGAGNAYNPFLYTADPRTYLKWKLLKTGPLSAPIGVEGNAFVATKYANVTWPDVQITFIASHPGFDGGTLYKDFLHISTRASCF